MATLRRSAKSSDKWGMNELLAFNIKVIQSDSVQAFFGSPLPPLMVSSVILDHEKEPDNPVIPLSKTEIDFFGYMNDATAIAPGEESCVDDFIAFVLKMMQYDEGHRRIHIRKELRFEMCGNQVNAISDVCVMERTNRGIGYLLLVQEDKYHLSTLAADPEPQLIAQAIAAFSDSNRERSAAGIPLLESKTFAGITMVGTAPTFYKIPVTSELIISIATAQYPLTATIVERFVPPVPFQQVLKMMASTHWPTGRSSSNVLKLSDNFL